MNYCVNLKNAIATLIVAMVIIPSFGQIAEVVSLREITLKKDANPIMFQNMMHIVRNELDEKAMGAHVNIWMGERGERKGEYIHAYSFDFKAARDYYFPEAGGAAPRAEALNKRVQVPVDPGTMIEGTPTYTDYVLLGFDKLVTPRGGPVAGVRKVEVPVANQAAFEKIVIEKLQPYWQEHVDGMYVYLYKGDRGERKGQYLYVVFFDSIERRNAYYPSEGGDSSDAFKKATEGIPDFGLEKLGAKVVGDSYTDYVIVY